jgi:prevent-host-death family protein
MPTKGWKKTCDLLMTGPDLVYFSNQVMKLINIQAAKTHLSRLVEEVATGQDIVLAKAGKPLVRLVPYVQTQGERLGGQFRGEIWQADDCWDDSSSLLDESISSGLFHQITEPALAAEEASRA